MCYQQKLSTQIARVPRTYVVYVAENKEVPDSNIGVPPVRKYANYRTLLVTSLIKPSSLLQVVNSLFQTCYNNWEQAVRTQLVDSL
jgi:hypothetical protein